MEAGSAEVGVDEKGLQSLLGEGDGGVEGGVGFAFFGDGADEENDAALGFGTEHGEGDAEGAVGFGERGGGVFDAGDGILVALGAGAVGFFHLHRFVVWDADEGGEMECALGFVHGAEGGVEAVDEDDSADGGDEGEGEGEGDHAFAVGLGGAAGDEGLLDEAEGGLLDAGGEGGLLHAGDDGVVERAVGLDIALEDIEGDGDFVEFERGGFLFFEGGGEFLLGLDAGFVLAIEDVAGFADAFGEGFFEGVDAGGGGDVLGVFLAVAILEGGELGVRGHELLAGFGDLRNLRDAADAQEVFDIGGIDEADLLDVGLEAEALAFGVGDFAAEFAQPGDDDVLAVFERDGLFFLFVALELGLGFLELAFEFLGLLGEKVGGDLGDGNALADVFAEELFHERGGEVAGHDGVGILDRDVDKAGAFAELDADLAAHLVGELDIGGIRAGGDEGGIVAEVLGLDDAEHQIAAGEGLDDGVDEVDGGGIFLADALNFDDLLLLLLDLEDGAGLVDFRQPHHMADGGNGGDAGDEGDDPPAAQQDMEDAAEVDGGSDLVHGRLDRGGHVDLVPVGRGCVGRELALG